MVGHEKIGDSHTHLFLEQLLNEAIDPGHRNRYRKEKVEPLQGATMINMFGLYAVSPDPNPEIETQKAEMAAILRSILKGLTPLQQAVLVLRFGLKGDDEMTLGEAAKALGGKSPNRIRMIEAKALRRLRHPEFSRLLKPFLPDVH